MNDVIIECETCVNGELRYCCPYLTTCLCIAGGNYVHPKYPEYKRKWNWYTFRLWEPKESLFRMNNILLTDKDFQI
jgi:hypothetical protein